MAPPVGGYVIKDTVFEVDGTDYANQCDKIRFVPDTPTQTKRTLVPDGVIQDVDSPVWTLEIAGIQDHVAGQGLAAYLNANAGNTLTVVYTPKPGGPTVTAEVLAKSVPFGGDQGAWAVVDVELPVNGQPVFV
jgi:hypothetical protein